MILIPCNNCNEHKIDPENCEFILDSENRISGFSFKKTERKSEIYYMVKNDFKRRTYSRQDTFYLEFLNNFKTAKMFLYSDLQICGSGYERNIYGSATLIQDNEVGRFLFTTQRIKWKWKFKK